MMYLLTIVLVIICFYFVMVVFLTLFQSRMIYYPQRTIVSVPSDIGLPYIEVTLETSDRVKLSAWFIPAENPTGVLLFCHGNAGNISNRMESLRVFNTLGLSTFIFDYRGYGKSEGRPSETGTYKDAEAAWQYLIEKQNFDPSEIIIFGRSLGGAIAVWLAQGKSVKALIVESSFTSIKDVATEKYPFLPVRLLSRFRYDSRSYLKNVTCPVLVIHSSSDELIPFKFGRQLFESAREPKEFLEISGGHSTGFMVSSRKYEDAVSAFIRRCSQ